MDEKILHKKIMEIKKLSEDMKRAFHQYNDDNDEFLRNFVLHINRDIRDKTEEIYKLLNEEDE